MSAAVLRLQGVSLRQGPVWSLREIDLSLAAGERLALVGANGSGKSSLLRVLHGLCPPTQGQRWIAPGQRQAMLFQQPHMLRLSARHQVALALWLAGRRWREARALAFGALARVGLAEQAERRADQLSGGQRQRLALARAWALAPDQLLLDEPTASLDPHGKREVEALISAFCQNAEGQALTLVFASHNLGQVKRLASRVVYLERGRLLVDLPVADFFNPGRLAALSPAAHAFLQGELI